MPTTRHRAEALAREADARRFDDPATAAARLAEALALEPARHDWRVLRGLLCWSVADDDAARTAWRAVPDGVMETATARLYLGLERFFAWGPRGFAWGDARPQLEAVATGAGREARLARAALAIIREDWAAVREACRGDPGWEARLLLAFTDGTRDPAGDPAAARAGYETALREGVPLAWGYVNLSALCRHAGDLEAALRSAEQAVRLAPRLPEGLSVRAAARHARGDLDGALSDYTAALDAAPENAILRENRARLRSARGEFAGAVEDLTACLAASPGDARLLTVRGMVRASGGDLAAALADLDAAVGLAPGSPEARCDRADLRRRVGDMAGALADLDAAVDADPGRAISHAKRAEIRAELGDLVGAETGFTDALALGPRPLWWMNRGILRQTMGREAEAVADFTAAIEGDATLWDALSRRGEIRWALGDRAAGLADLEAAIRLAPPTGEAYGALGNAYWEEGRRADAVPLYRVFLARRPDHAHAAQTQARLREAGEEAPPLPLPGAR